MRDAVRFLLERMDTNPEEFYQQRSNAGKHEWLSTINAYKKFFNDEESANDYADSMGNDHDYDDDDDLDEGILDTVKKVGGKVLDTLGHGSDEDLIKDLTIANNLNHSLLQDKLDLQQEVRKLQEKLNGVRSKSSKNR